MQKIIFIRPILGGKGITPLPPSMPCVCVCVCMRACMRVRIP